VFTAPEARGQGLGRRVSQAATANLIALGIPTIVLNVSMDNEPACQLYRRLGYHPYCGYYEGVGRLAP
jgi:ribosomal protein S18 acetylase RimI-like enzyme